MISCKEYVHDKKEQLKTLINNKTAEGYVKPMLSIVQIGDEFASNKYIAGKIKDCEEVGINANLIKLPNTIDGLDLYKELLSLDAFSNGIIVQLPVPEHLNAFHLVKSSIHPNHDVDGFIFDNHSPCTPLGIMQFLQANKDEVNLDGANVTIIGRSKIVGEPLARMMNEVNATVTLCHSHTKNLREHIANADIIVSAVGKPHIITSDMLGDNLKNKILIDVGVSRSADNKVLGDFDYDNIVGKVKFITNPTGNVGLLTRVTLLENTVKAWLVDIEG